jgi:phosphoglycerol transferase MdoB-like AlkP superfamily enzyme
MNKRINTLLFVLGATAFNVIITILSFIGFFVLYISLIAPLTPEATHSWAFAFIFLASIAVSFVAYRFLFKYLLKKIDVDKYFDPLFIKKYKK